MWLKCKICGHRLYPQINGDLYCPECDSIFPLTPSDFMDYIS